MTYLSLHDAALIEKAQALREVDGEALLALEEMHFPEDERCNDALVLAKHIVAAQAAGDADAMKALGLGLDGLTLS